MHKSVSLNPRLNEKTYALSDTRVYVFDVEKGVNKHTIARAVEAQFDVSVVSVRTLNSSGKAKRVISLDGKRYQNAEGRRKDTKKAYVTLKEGQALPFFQAVEEAEEKQEKVQKRVDKIAEKEAKKEEKKTSRRGLLHRNRGKNDEDKEESK